MDRNRESRRGALSGSFSSSRRRSRSIGIRDSTGFGDAEDGGGSNSVRDRSNGKKERPSRRRRLSSNGRSHVDRDEENGSSDESFEDDDNDEEDGHVRGSGSGGSFSRRIDRAKPQLKGPDEVIGVSVPRRARSASAKRSQDWSSRQFSSSPLRTSAASPSPPSSNASTKATRKVKPLTKAKPSKTSKVSISESEVEVAQFLYGLTMLQSHQSPAQSDAFRSPYQVVDHKHNSEKEGSGLFLSKTSSPESTPVSPQSSQPVMLPQNSSSISTTATVPKRKKPRTVQLEDGDNSSMMACTSKPSVCSSIGNNSNSSVPASLPKTEANKDSPAAKTEILSPKSDKNIISNEETASKSETSLPISSPSLICLPINLPLAEEKPIAKSSLESKTSMLLEKNLQTTYTSKVEETGILEVNLLASADVVEKESSAPGQDTAVSLISDVKPETVNVTSPGSAAAEGTKVVKFEIDLMAPPKNDDDDEAVTMAPQASNQNTNPVIGEATSKTEVITNTDGQVEAEEARGKNNHNSRDLEQNMQMEETVKVETLDKQLHNEKKTKSSNVDDQKDKSDKKQHFQKLSRNSARATDRTGPPVGIMASTSNPVPITVPGWPGGLPPFGYLGSSPSNLSGLQAVQATLPKEGNYAIPNPPFTMPPQARPSRCATHCFIARLIHYQQQMARLKPFWHPSGSAALYGGKPYNLNMLPPSESILFSAGSVVRNPTMVSNGNLGPGSVITLNGHTSTDKLPNSFADNQRKPPQLTQSTHQMPAFIFPFTQNGSSGTKSCNAVENATFVSASAGSAAAGSAAAPAASVNPNFGNVAANQDLQYLAMLHSSYPFPISPAYRAHMTQQQQPGAPFFGGSIYPAHLFQLQSHMLPHSDNQNHSTSSVSSSKPPPESCRTEAESVQDQEGGSEVQILPTKKKRPGHNISGIPNFHQNFAMIPPSLSGKHPQQQPGPNLHMSLKGVEATAGSFPSGHPMLQTMPNLGLHQYRIGGGPISIQAANQSKAPAKTAAPATVTDKFPEPSHTQSLSVSAKQQLQKQIMARTQPMDSSVLVAGGSSGDHTDRFQAVYSNAGTGFQGGSMGFPQWKMFPSERAAPGGLPGNFVQSGMVVAAAETTQNVGSSVAKASRVASPPMNPTHITPSSGSSVMALSGHAQCQPKTQQLYFSNESAHQSSGSSTLSSQRHSAEMSSARQAMFPDALNLRRPANQQAQPSLTMGGTGAYLGGGKNHAVFGHPLAGSSVAVMAAASYTQSAANLPVKSAEQKPAAA